MRPDAVPALSSAIATRLPRSGAEAWGGGWRSVRTSARAHSAGVLGLYVAVAIAYFGRFWLSAPGSGTIGMGPDVQIFVWALRWWPFALGHGLNPLVSHVLWAPYGSDILWTSTVPLISLLFAPVTMTLGPAFAWNLLCVLAPASSAWAAYLLCRELSGAPWPSVAGGFLFGFSSYQLAEGLGHLHMTATLLVPLGALVAVRYLRGRMTGRGMAVRLGLIAVAQFLIAPEILATMAVMGALAAVAVIALMPGYRQALRGGLGWAAAGLAGAGIVVAPVLIAMLGSAPGQSLNAPANYSADLANFVVPSPVTALGGRWAIPIALHFPGNLAEQVAYLGLPLLLILVGFLYVNRSSAGARLLAVLVVGAIVLSLGPRLHVDSHHSIAWLPGSLLFDLPVMKYALPARFALYTALVAAVIVAMWLASAPRQGWWRWAAVGAVAVSLAPAPIASLWWRSTPPSILRNDLGRIIPAGSTVISLPFWGADERGLYAQAAAGMSFRIADRWMPAVPPQYSPLTLGKGLAGARITRAEVPLFNRLVCQLGADYAVVWNDFPWRAQFLAILKLKPIRADNLLIYRLPRSACRRAPVERDILVRKPTTRDTD